MARVVFCHRGPLALTCRQTGPVGADFWKLWEQSFPHFPFSPSLYSPSFLSHPSPLFLTPSASPLIMLPSLPSHSPASPTHPLNPPREYGNALPAGLGGAQQIVVFWSVLTHGHPTRSKEKCRCTEVGWLSRHHHHYHHHHYLSHCYTIAWDRLSNQFFLSVYVCMYVHTYVRTYVCICGHDYGRIFNRSSRNLVRTFGVWIGRTD